MKQRNLAPRIRPIDDAVEPPLQADALPASEFLQACVAPTDLPQPQPASGPEPQRNAERWQGLRDQLADLVDAGALTTAQEADCFRLFEAWEAEVRETVTRLVAELKPHFDTDGETEAMQRFTEGLQEMKRKQDEEFSRLLKSFGMEA